MLHTFPKFILCNTIYTEKYSSLFDRDIKILTPLFIRKNIHVYVIEMLNSWSLIDTETYSSLRDRDSKFLLFYFYKLCLGTCVPKTTGSNCILWYSFDRPFDVQFYLILFLRRVTVIGWNKSRDSFLPITEFCWPRQINIELQIKRVYLYYIISKITDNNFKFILNLLILL